MNEPEIYSTRVDQTSLHQLIAWSADGIMMTNEAGAIIEWNTAMERLTGLPRSEALGNLSWEVLSRLSLDRDQTAEHEDLRRSYFMSLLSSGVATGIDQIHLPAIQDTRHVTHCVDVSAFAFSTDHGYRAVALFRDITPFRSAELQLRTLQQAVEQSPLTVIVTDRDGNIEFANSRLSELTGYTLDEVRGMNPRIFQSGLTPIEVYEDLWNTVISGREWRGELRNRKKNGDLFWEAARISPVFDDRGEIRQFVAVKEDITQRKQQELALRESEERFRTTFEQAAVGITHVSLDGHYLLVNQKFCELTGYSREELLATTFLDITHAEDRDLGAEQRARMLKGELSTYSLEKRYLRKDGTLLWVEVTVSHTRHEDGSPGYYIVVAQDISEKLAARLELERLHQEQQRQNARLETVVSERTAELRHLNERMATIFDHTSDVILLIDVRNQIENTNRAFEHQFGYERDEMNGSDLRTVVEEGSAEDLLSAVSSVRENRVSQRLHVRCVTRSGQTFDADVALAFVPDHTGHIVCSIRDITGLKEVERAKDALISMVSHELKTPLAAIMLGTDNLTHYYDRMTDEKRLQKLYQLRLQALNLTELVTSILDIAHFDGRRPREHCQPVDLCQTMLTVTQELQGQAEIGDQHIEVTVSETPITMLGNSGDLSRIWRNLIGNAIKYGGEGCTILVRLYSPEMLASALPPELGDFLDSLPVDVTCGKYAVGLVSDDGPGLPSEDMPHMFTRFYRGWASQTDIPGTGLGLPLVRDILQSYRGDITLRANPGQGAHFCFWLPVQDYD